MNASQAAYTLNSSRDSVQAIISKIILVPFSLSLSLRFDSDESLGLVRDHGKSTRFVPLRCKIKARKNIGETLAIESHV